MKITKILSAVAACAVATTALAATASAMFKPLGNSSNGYVLSDASNLAGIVPYSNGSGDAPASSLAADYGFELSDVGGAFWVVTVPETDSYGADVNQLYFDGSIGGGVVSSLHSDTDISTYNWVSFGEFWGISDPELGLETAAADKTFGGLEKVGDYTYKLTAAFNCDEDLANLEGEMSQWRIFMQVWDNGLAEYEIKEVGLLDDAGNVLCHVDAQGNPVGGTSTDTGSDAVVDTDAPATTPDKGSADTGVEGVAAVAGLAVVAGGAMLLSKKRK